jgi:hypothetical protein
MNNPNLSMSESEIKALVDFFGTLLEWSFDIMDKGESL